MTRTPRTLGMIAGAASSLLVFACLDAPTFINTDNTGPSGVAPGVSEDMVLVPRTTILTSAAEPANNGKGKGPGEKDPKDPKPPKPPKDGGGDSSGSSSSSSSSGGDTSSSSSSTSSGGAPSPQPLVVGPFWIDVREVSVADYASCVSAGACAKPRTDADARCNALDAIAVADHPINCVTHDQAAAYCTWRSKRLVRNDEHTAAVSGNASRRYPWGDALPSAELLNACGAECVAAGAASASMYGASDGFVTTAPRGSYVAGQSSEGVFDLSGNVAEWVEDPTTGSSLVRGGSFADADAADVSAGGAHAVSLDATLPTIGFRCARSP